MPVHRVQTRFPDFEKAVEQIEENETIKHVIAQGAGAAIVITDPKVVAKKRATAGEVETR